MKRNIKRIIVMCMVISLLCSCGNSHVSSGAGHASNYTGSKGNSDKLEECIGCGGTGICCNCNGEGERFSVGKMRPCNLCGQSGICHNCNGSGLITREKLKQIARELGIDIKFEDEEDDINIVTDTPSPDNEICDDCGGSGRSSIRCTYCGGSGIDPAYEATKGSAIHSFADKECAECGGTGLERCKECWGTGEK